MPLKRAAFTADERRALHAHKAEHSKLTQKNLSEWFANKFGKPIQQSTVSEILSTRWSHLDEDEQPVQRSAKRFKSLAYPDLDRALAEWVLRAQKDITITGDVCRESKGSPAVAATAAVSRPWRTTVEYWLAR